MAKHPAREPSQRQLRVGEQIRHIVADTLRRGHFHHANLVDGGGLSVTEVRVSPDLKNATAYIIPIMSVTDMAGILESLNDSAQFFQKEINRQASLKFTPRIRFKNDDAYHEAQKIERLLHEVRSSYADEE